MEKKTKEVTCIACGETIQVSLFMSPKKAKCDTCKKNNVMTVFKSLVEEKSAPAKENPVVTEYMPSKKNAPVFIPDKPMKTALAGLCCPHHTETTMEITSVVRSSTYGDCVALQCPVCFTIVQITEPNQFPERKRVKLEQEFEDKDKRVEHIKGALTNKSITETMTIKEEIEWVEYWSKL